MTKTAHLPAEYGRLLRRKRLLLAAVLTALLAAMLAAVCLGSIALSPWEVVRTLLGGGAEQSRTVVFGIRLPRVVSAVLVGAILGSSGAVMQCVLHNPLASASTLGVSQGAGFGAALGIIVFGGGVVHSSSSGAAVEIGRPGVVTLCAFVFGLLTTLAILALSQLRRRLGAGGLVLAGVALSSLFSGGSTLLQYFADDAQIGAVVFWTFGNLGGTGWTENAALAAALAGSLLYFFWNRWRYNAMGAGTEAAQGLGVNARMVMLAGMAVSSLAVSAAVSFVGIIGFVGLIAPHMMRRLIGEDYRFLIPGSAAAGALLLIAADTFGRMAVAPVVLPVGAITSFVGAPVFLVLLWKGANRR